MESNRGARVRKTFFKIMAKFSKSDEYKPKDPRESANTKRKREENYTKEIHN